MGALVRATVYAAEENGARDAARAAFRRIAQIEAAMSDYRQDSELMRLCRQPAGTAVRVSGELWTVLEKAQELARETRGAFDVTVGPQVRLWRKARTARELPSPEALALARHSSGYGKLILNPLHRTVTLGAEGMSLDLGGIAKGYAADAALQVLREKGFPRALVAVAGDIAAGEAPPGKPGWRIGLDNEGAPVLTLRNAAISTSGDTERFVEFDGIRYSHVVDPRTGVGLTGSIRVTVISRRAVDTDSLATAVSVLGAERGLALVEAKPETAALVTENGRVLKSKRFPAGNFPPAVVSNSLRSALPAE